MVFCLRTSIRVLSAKNKKTIPAMFLIFTKITHKHKTIDKDDTQVVSLIQSTNTWTKHAHHTHTHTDTHIKKMRSYYISIQS